MILSHAATIRRGGKKNEWTNEEHSELMIHDGSRAYFYAPATRSVLIELPAEDGDAPEGEVGRLNVCLYGTRDDAKEWQHTLSRHSESIGLGRGVGHPVVFHNPARGIKTLVHGGDYVSAAASGELD